MAILERGELELYYEVRGTGPRLLFFNGSGSTIETSGLLIDILARDFTVAVADQRGLGRTGLARNVTPNMADYAADGPAMLDALGWPRALVVGLSFGGMVAQEFAVTYPERVEKLVLLCTSAGGDGGSSYPLHTLNDMSSDERAKVRLTILDTRFTPEWLAEHPENQFLADMAAASGATTKSLEVMTGEAYQLEARRQHDVWDRLENISAPTFIAAGEFDGTAPMANSEALASRIVASTLHRYLGGHAFLAQDGRALPEILTFLKGE